MLQGSSGTMVPCTSKSRYYGASARIAIMSGFPSHCQGDALSAKVEDGMGRWDILMSPQRFVEKYMLPCFLKEPANTDSELA